MPSFRSRLFVFALKHRHLLRFQLKRRSAITWDTSIPQLREETERSAGFFGKLPADIDVTGVDIGGLHAEWIAPSRAPSDKAVLYFHGGGYAIGSCKAHRGIIAKFVKRTGIPALVFDYRLAPEHPFPAALDDSIAAYQWLLSEGVEAGNIAFIGDSAGGGLCLCTLLALRDKDITLPAAAVALSPWTDLKNTGESWETNAEKDSLCWREAQTVFSKYYAGDSDPGLPWMSPLYGDLDGLPPLLIFVGGDELMLSDSTRFAENAEAAGVNVTLRVGEGLFHCYPVCAPLFPEATQAMTEVCAFVKSRVNQQRGNQGTPHPMAQREKRSQRRDVRRMFNGIAPRYDLLNRLLSFRRDVAWRKAMLDYVPDRTDLRVLDLATGTGDVLLALDQARQPALSVGADVAEAMLALAQEKAARSALGRLSFVRNDATALAFVDGSLDAVTVAFGIRNVGDVPSALQEMRRVLAPGGRAVILEFSVPTSRLFRPAYLVYLRHVLPRVGGLISGDRNAYHYLNRTIETFPCGEAFCALMEAAGFKNARARPLTMGIATIYTGERSTNA